MEHDIERRIREKVNRTDETFVSWQKEKTWLTIENNIATKQRMSVYYIAASVTLFISLSILVTPQTNQIKSSGSASLSKKEILNNKEFLKENELTELVIDCKPDIEHIPDTQKQIAQTPEKQDTIMIKTTILKESAPDDNKLITQNTSHEEPVTMTIASKNIEPVHAIFGTEEKSIPVTLTKRNKKVRLRLFKTEEESNPVRYNSEATNLFAQIKRN